MSIMSLLLTCFQAMFSNEHDKFYSHLYLGSLQNDYKICSCDADFVGVNFLKQNISFKSPFPHKLVLARGKLGWCVLV